MTILSNLSGYIAQKIASQPKNYIIIEAVVAVVLILFFASNGCVQFRDIEKEQAVRQQLADKAFEE